METVNPTEFGRICGVSKQAIFKAIAEGTLPVIPSGKKKLIDLNDPAVVIYMNVPGRKLCLDRPSKKREEKPIKTKITSKLRDDILPLPRLPSDSGEMDLHEINNRTKIAEMRAKEAKASALEKRLLPVEFIEDGLFRYIEKLNSNLERSANIFIKDIGQKILESGEVLPEHSEKFISMVLNLIHETKKNIRKEIEKYEPVV